MMQSENTFRKEKIKRAVYDSHFVFITDENGIADTFLMLKTKLSSLPDLNLFYSGTSRNPFFQT